MKLFKDSHLVNLELLSNATTIDSALSYIKNKQQEKHLSLDSTNDDDSSDSNDNSQISTGRQTVF